MRHAMTAASGNSDAGNLAERARGLAHAVGFDLAGIARAGPVPESEYLREWLERGFAGDMHYLENRLELRIDPRKVLPGARSILAVALVYDPGPRPDPEPDLARIARYAGGEDYHEVIWERLRALEAALETLSATPITTRSFCDTGPVLERVFAARAGLGWQGKNTCLIHPRLGSYLFLGVVLTDLDLAPDKPEIDHCGSCRACLDACPTAAFPEPYVLDATRCLSYTTIESRGAIAPELRAEHQDWVYGCDICQEVCPWNQRRARSVPADPFELRSRLAPRPEWVQPSLAWILGLDEAAWRAATRGTALRRSKYRGMIRNALVVAGSSGTPALLPALERWAGSDDAMLAEHARWAIERIGVAADRPGPR